jgi:hypothetical protein
MVKVDLNHLTDEELEELVYFGEYALGELDEALHQITQAGVSIDNMARIIGDHKFLGGGPRNENQVTKILGDIYDELEEAVEEAKIMLRTNIRPWV